MAPYRGWSTSVVSHENSNRLAAFVQPYSMTTSTRDEITKLTPPKRLSLIGGLWNSIADTELPVLPAQRSELERRLASVDEDRGQAVTWNHLKAELAARTP